MHFLLDQVADRTRRLLELRRLEPHQCVVPRGLEYSKRCSRYPLAARSPGVQLATVSLTLPRGAPCLLSLLRVGVSQLLPRAVTLPATVALLAQRRLAPAERAHCQCVSRRSIRFVLRGTDGIASARTLVRLH